MYSCTLYRSCPSVVDVRYNPESERSFAEVLIDAVAQAADTDPTELPPLYDTIDVDVLTQLFETHDGETGTGAVLRFTFQNWTVFVRADGRIRICDETRTVEPKPVFAE